MIQPHFLLQDWLQWAQGAIAFLQGGGLPLLRDASGSYDPGRDVGNGVDGLGGGALTGDAFKRLTGFNTPAAEAPDGFHRIRDVFGGWVDDILGGPGTGSGSGSGSGSGAETPGPQPTPPQHFPLEDFVPGGSGGQGTPPPTDVRLEDVLPDDLR